MLKYSSIIIIIFAIMAIVFNKQISELARTARGFSQDSSLWPFRIPAYIISIVILAICGLIIFGGIVVVK
jgi:hypothetical protein